MFDNVAFEVVIGLVFIYLLYSLLITIVGEIISTVCGIRPRLLRIAVERMFNDGYYQKVERRANKYRDGSDKFFCMSRKNLKPVLQVNFTSIQPLNIWGGLKTIIKVFLLQPSQLT